MAETAEQIKSQIKKLKREANIIKKLKDEVQALAKKGGDEEKEDFIERHYELQYQIIHIHRSKIPPLKHKLNKLNNPK